MTLLRLIARQPRGAAAEVRHTARERLRGRTNQSASLVLLIAAI